MGGWVGACVRVRVCVCVQLPLVPHKHNRTRCVLLDPGTQDVRSTQYSTLGQDLLGAGHFNGILNVQNQGFFVRSTLILYTAHFARRSFET